jgi:hypothetical protein
MKSQSKKWANQYTKNNKNPIYPTEWVIRTISGANYPNFKYDKKLYEGKKNFRYFVWGWKKPSAINKSRF